MAPPEAMKAIKIVEKGKAEIQTVPLPRLRDDYVLVKVKSVALNPTDWKHVHMLATPGCTVGCDFSGVVEEVGPKVTKALKKGDRIAAFTHGVNAVEPEDGCFAEYAVCKGDLVIKLPDDVNDDEAATLPVAIVTCGLALYQALKLPFPGTEKAGYPLLVYGGSTATGSIAIQLAVLSGAQVVTTCSPRNNALLKSLGASETFDYNDPDCGKKIREYTNDSLTKVLDCISEHESPQICEGAISSRGGEICYLLFTAKHDRDDVEWKHILGYTVTGESFKMAGTELPASPEDFEFTREFAKLFEKLIVSKQLTPHPQIVGKGGLEGCFEGMQMLREGKVSGAKLVYRIDETP